ncbi:MAG: transposase, partial [Bacteroidales bacterium]|nr:transposase [Bacteroidales bacterium]
RQHNKFIENEKYAKQMIRKRSSTVEPVLGTLLNFTGMRKTYARGIGQAEKHVLMASLCYNLKKMMKFRVKKVQVQVNYVPIIDKMQETSDLFNLGLIRRIFLRFKPI